MGTEIDRLEIIVEAEAKKASAELDKLISKLEKAGTTIRGVSGLSLGKNISSSNIGSTTNSMSKYTKSVSSAIGSTRSLTSQLSRMAFAFYSLQRIVNFIGSSIKKSMDFTETVNLFQTSFKKIGMEEAQANGYDWGSASADAFAKGYIDRSQKFNDLLTSSLGLDPNTMMNYQAIFAQMSNSMGLVTDSAMNISESFTMLGNDIASLWNIDTATAMQKLQSGLAGQIRPLRQLGIDISQTSLEMTALKYGITDNITQMSQAAKVQLRWLSVMDQAEVAFGDMAKTIDSPANQLRVLKQQWDLLSRSIGNVFLPAVTSILPYINAVVIALRNMISTLATAMGYEMPDYTDSNIYTDITGDIEGMTDATDDATAANEKLKRSMVGIDELNILSDNSSSSSANATGSGYSVLDDAIQQKTDSYMKKFNDELEKMSNKSKVMAENIKEFFWNFADKISPTVLALGNLWDAIKPFAENVGQGIMYFLGGVFDIGEDAITKWIPNGLNAIANAIKLIPEDVAVALGGAISGIVVAIVSFNTIANALDAIDDAKDAISTFINTVKAQPLLLVASALAAVVGSLAAYNKYKFNNSELGTFLTNVKSIVEASKNFNKETQAMLDNHNKRKSDIISEYGAIDILADKYFSLADEENRTNDENDLMKAYAQELINKIPELNGLIDEQTGAYKGTKKEIQACIDKSKEYYLVKAAEESLIEIATAQFNAQKDLKTLEEERKIVVDDLATAQNNLKSAMGQKEINEARKAYIETKDALAEIDDQIKTTKDTQKKLNNEWDYATDYISTYSSTTQKELPKVNTAVQSALESAKKSVSGFKLPSIKLNIEFDEKTIEMPNVTGGKNVKIHILPSGYAYPEVYATGGYPTPGQVFIANEPGNPELIGNVGGKTAVVNNNQIVDAVSQGVAAAVAGVLGGQGGGQIIHNILKLNDDVVYESYERGKQSNKFRYSPA